MVASVVLTDSFNAMPTSARCLYFMLNTLAAEDGFVSGVREIMNRCGASNADAKLLLDGKYIIADGKAAMVVRSNRMRLALNDKEESTKEETNSPTTLLSSKEESNKETQGCNNNYEDLLNEKQSISPTISPTIAQDNNNIYIPFKGNLLKAFNDWLQYKAEKREIYKDMGLKSLITQVSKAADKYGESAVIEQIMNSIASGYKGITWDRLEKRGGITNVRRPAASGSGGYRIEYDI